MTDEISSFSSPIEKKDTSTGRLYLNGSTCDTYVVRAYGKLHFKKKLKAEYKGKPQYVEAFKKEFEVGYRLEHPALPKYVALKEEDGCPCIFEEYIEGETLTDFLKQHPDYFHSRKHADKFIDDLLSAFAYLHEHQVLFLDLKPDNVMITTVGHQLRLVDLGGCHTDMFVGTEEITRKYSPTKENSHKGGGKDEKWGEAFDVYLIGRLLQYAKIPHLYNNVVGKCLRDNPLERYSDVESLSRAIAGVRHRSFFYKAMIAAVVIIAIFSLSAILIHKEQPGQVQEKKPVQASKVVSSPMPASDSTMSKTATTPQSPVVAVPKPTSTSVGKPKQQNETDEQRMTRELQKEMEFAYNKYIASLPEDSINDGVCLGNHVVMYMDYINPVMERLKKKYPNLEPHAVDTKWAEIYSKTVLPLTEKAFSTKP